MSAGWPRACSRTPAALAGSLYPLGQWEQARAVIAGAIDLNPPSLSWLPAWRPDTGAGPLESRR